MDASILICTHDRAALLDRLLGSIAAARPPAALNLETVVVANRCTGATGAVVADWRRRGGVAGLRLVEEPELGKSHALNRGVAAARGELLLFADDDHRVAAGWLEAVARAVAVHPEAACYCGRILPDWDGSEPAWVHDDGPYRIRPYPVPNFDLGEEERPVMPGDFIPGGGNLFFPRTLIDRLGGFDATLGPHGHDLGGAEDIAFVGRILDAGLPLWYCPGALQYHYVDPARLTLGYVVRKAYQRARDTRRARPSAIGRCWLGAPCYLFAQLAGHAGRAATAWSANRRRHCLVRTAATLGEIRGSYQAARRGR